MDYKITPQSGNSYSHVWDVSSMKTFDGGFLLDKTNLPEGLEKLPKGVFLKGDFTERTAKVVKTAVLTEAITTESTAVKVKKGALLKEDDILGAGTKSAAIGAVDTSNADYDSISITANAFGALAAGSVLQSYDAAGSNKNAVNPDGLNPVEEVRVDREPSVSIMFRADGIVTSRLPQGVTDAIKAALKYCQFLDE